MNIRQLEYVDAITRCGTVRGAAMKLFVSQPNVSQQIHELERELGVKLFEQVGRTLQMTNEGRMILPKIRGILSEIYDMNAIIQEINDPLSGNIRFGTIPSGAMTILRPVLQTYTSSFPKVKVEVHEAGSLELIERVNNGDFDAAIVATSDVIPFNEQHSLKTHHLVDGKIIAVVSSDHVLSSRRSVSLEELRDERIILFRSGYLVREIVLKTLSPMSNNVVCSIDNSESVRVFTRSGMGILFLPTFLLASWARTELEGLCLVEITGVPLNIHLSCIVSSKRHNPKFTMDLVSIVAEQAKLYFNNPS